jgi:hypothetical protein
MQQSLPAFFCCSLWRGTKNMYDISLICNAAGFCMCCIAIALLVVWIFACVFKITFKDGDKVFFSVKAGLKKNEKDATTTEQSIYYTK